MEAIAAPERVERPAKIDPFEALLAVPRASHAHPGQETVFEVVISSAPSEGGRHYGVYRELGHDPKKLLQRAAQHAALSLFIPRHEWRLAGRNLEAVHGHYWLVLSERAIEC